MALLDAKAKPSESLDPFSSSSQPPAASNKLPSFLSIFQPTEEAKTSDNSPRSWSSGQPIVKDYSVKEDPNKRGLRRTKKKAQYWQGSGKVEMEDQHLILFPFGTQSRGLFCVFDGHAGTNCALAAKAIFPKVFFFFLFLFHL